MAVPHFFLRRVVMAKKNDDREARIKNICDTINKGTFGGEKHDAVTYLGSGDSVSMERFPSGCPALDDALGGGWPKGRFIEIFGSESGGKTTLVLHALAEHQKKYPDEDIGLIDSEFSFDEEYAKALGVDTKYLIVNQPESGEQALNILSQLIKGDVRCIVVDSVAALTTKAELDGDIGDIHVGEQARLMSQALRRLVQEAGSRNTTIFWTNQVREKIGIMYGDKNTTPAGRALKHYASIRAKVDRIGTVKEKIHGEDVAVCNKTKVDVKKNKTAPPFRVAEFYISYGHGIDSAAALLDGALARKVVVKRGAWFQFGDEQLGQGRLAVLDVIRTNADWNQKITKALEEAKAKGVPESEPEQEQEQKLDIKRPKAGKKTIDADAIDSSEDDGKVEVRDV
jgi:recombination protein RecA